ncbi:VWA domain-containing protein [Fortiea sp. LEGE XX443]|uniref:vWA domain-containing protein n=1 Tax=Fortiea sp. LEGE XX443 TaxID=1828611 RepID=UPI0018823CD6|nr:vWA domain-containing protein [Fortiea sp. LEGE XX443]MBE9006801.1 VWA domain-containing protein [Fortiea sp. LEGE XX443]
MIYDGISWGWRNQTKRRRQDQCTVQYISDNGSNSDCFKIDLEFLFDTTGSMGSSIGAVQTAATDILNQLEALGVDYRIAIADYKDFPEQYGYPYRAVLPFSTDKTAIINSINSLSGDIWGGGDTPESAYSGLIRTINTEGLGSWRDNAKRAVVIMTDAPPHDPEPHTGYTSKDVVDAAYAMGISRNLYNTIIANDAVDPVSIYSIIVGGDSSATYYLSKISKQTGGKLYQTSSSSDIVNALFDITGDVTDTTYDDIIDDENPQSVPEPSSITGLLAVILAGLSLSRSKHKKQVEAEVIDCAH